MDVLPETAKSYVAVELKNGTRWDKRFNHSLHRLSGELDGKMVSCFGVYMGERELAFDDVKVLSAIEFLRRLWSGEVIEM